MNKFLVITLIFLSYFELLHAEPGVSTFMYHRFGESKYPSTNVTEEQFLSHIEYIMENGIKVDNAETINTSFPKFYETMKSIGANLRNNR